MSNTKAPTQAPHPAKASPAPSSLLQRTCACGNHTPGGGECAECKRQKLQRKPLQRKPLTINTPGDQYEQEADKVADMVTRSESLRGESARGVSFVSLPTVSRFAGGDGAAGGTAPPIVHDVLNSPGQPLDAGTRAMLEPRFGRDFGGVRVHTNGRAAESAKAVNARAYTVGNNVVFGAGQYAPASAEGRRLMAHELTHVVQQLDNLYRDSDDKEKDKILTKLSSGELDDRDLENSRLRNRLTGLITSEINDLIAKIKNHQKNIHTTRILEFLEIRKHIATPLPLDATVNYSSSKKDVMSYTLSLQNIKIEVLPNIRNKMKNVTSLRTNFDNYTWETAANEMVTKFTNNNDKAFNPKFFLVRIQTSFQQSLDLPSAYGKGTTTNDKEERTTTLRVHEGQHGTDYIDFFRKNPFPVDLSKGVVNVLKANDMTKIDEYIKKMNKHLKDMGESTDQMGIPAPTSDTQ